MKKFKCTVTREDEYVIELDEKILDKAWMEWFKKYFYDFDDLQEHAEYIAQYAARFGSDFIEGYGIPLRNGERPIFVSEDKVLNKAININVITEDGYCEVDVEEI